MNLLTDFAFKKVFGSEENKKVLIKFLNAVLEGKDRIIDVQFRDKEQLPFVEEGKRMVFDIYCTASDGSHIIIEMQRTIQPTFSERAIAYCSHGILNQIRRGKRYRFDRVYGVFVMDFHMVDQKHKLMTRVCLMDVDSNKIFSDKLEMLFLDLKCMRRNSFDECKDDVERWLFLIKNMEDMEDKVKDYPMFDDLFDAADKGSLAAEELVTYGQSRLKLEEDREGMEYYGEMQLRKGIEKGIERGKLSMLKEIVNRLKSNGMSPSQVAEIIGRPVAELESIWALT